MYVDVGDDDVVFDAAVWWWWCDAECGKVCDDDAVRVDTADGVADDHNVDAHGGTAHRPSDE
jgi:hypothetical protein